jgi:hypothetical protein
LFSKLADFNVKLNNEIRHISKPYIRQNQLPFSALQVATWVLNMFCNIYLVKNQKMPNSSTIIEARGKTVPVWDLWSFRKHLMYISID